MKLFMLAALAAVFSFAQTPAPAPDPAKTVLKTKVLKSEDWYHLASLIAQQRAIEAEALRQKEQKLLPFRLEQNELVTKLCSEIGIPQDKIETECFVDTDKAKGKGFGEVRHEKRAETPPNEPTKSK